MNKSVPSLHTNGDVMPICAVPTCGSTKGVELHHLYSKQDGCPDDLVVPLCHVCHGRAHQFRRRLDISLLASEGSKRRNQKYRGRIKPTIDQLLTEVGDCEELAARLTADGVKNYHGKVFWTVVYVKNLLKALEHGDFLIEDTENKVKKSRKKHEMRKVAQRDQIYEPVIREIMDAGILSYHGIAAELERREIPTVTRGAPWGHQAVRRILGRLGLDKGPQEYDPTAKDTEIEPLIRDMLAKGITSYKAIARGLTELGIATATDAPHWNPITTKAAMCRLGLAHHYGVYK